MSCAALKETIVHMCAFTLKPASDGTSTEERADALERTFRTQRPDAEINRWRKRDSSELKLWVTFRQPLETVVRIALQGAETPWYFGPCSELPREGM
jgi:hypothetical protein